MLFFYFEGQNFRNEALKRVVVKTLFFIRKNDSY